jgi:hypothetical protein
MDVPMVGSGGARTCAEGLYSELQPRKEIEIKINDSKIHYRRGENVKSKLVTRQLLSP